MKRAAAALFAVLSFWPVNAHAHLVSTRFGELYSGMLHPVLAFEHLLPWVALGLLGALAGHKTARWAVPVFPLSVFAGVLVAAVLPGAEGVSILNLASFVLLGGLVAANVALPTTAFLVLVTAFGLTHGYGNEAGELRGPALVLYALGVALSAYAVVTLVTAFAYTLTRRPGWGQIAVRAAGSWVLAIGLVFSGFSMLTSA